MRSTPTSGSMLAVLILALTPVAPLQAQRFDLAVTKDQTLGSSRGTLTFDSEEVVYETPDAGDRRRWTYDDIKQVQLLSPTRITVETFEDQPWYKLGADRAFEFEVTSGAISPDLVAFLWARIQRPLVTAIPPSATGAPRASVPVKLRQRLQGSNGRLELYEGRLVYVSDRAERQRAWRPIDVRLVYQPARSRLNIEAYEGGGDRTRTFSFDLKQTLPTGFLASVWHWLYVDPGSPPARQAAR